MKFVRGQYLNTKLRYENVVLRDRVKRLERALSRIVIRCCDVHHEPAERHSAFQRCPVVEKIDATCLRLVFNLN